jgi:cob(I)alamin adenosyltransferase
MAIYTRTGDLGETGLFAGPRVGKDMPRVEVYGTIDELNAVIGLARTEPVGEAIQRILERVQNELFQIGAELSTMDPAAVGTRWIGREHVRVLEAEIDRFEAEISPLSGFILPAGTRAAALFHVARTVCRRAERRLVTLVRHSEEPISLPLLAYLNRLGDLLFVLARAANAQAGRPDTLWAKPGVGPTT